MNKSSSIANKLLYKEIGQGNCNYFTERFENYSLEGRILFCKKNTWPEVIAIHGAKSDYSKLNPLLFKLQEQGVSSLSFNLSGHNITSTRCIHDTSLSNNAIETERFFYHLKNKSKNITIIGQSLGGALALKLAEKNIDHVKKIVLICPAIYTDIAYNINYGIDFKSIISKPYSFEKSSSFNFLRNFKGKILLILGEYDGLSASQFGGTPGKSIGNILINGKEQYCAIPKEVIDLIKSSVASNQFNIKIIKGCDHHISKWFRENINIANDISILIKNFIQSN